MLYKSDFAVLTGNGTYIGCFKSFRYFFDKTVCKIHYTSATPVVFHKIILLSIIIGYELSEIL